jgi:hypothetical protein
LERTVNPDLEARHIAASAVLDDFRSDLAGAPLSAPPPMAFYAFRLASMLGAVLAAVSRDEVTSANQREILGRALGDAISWREPNSGFGCRDCDEENLVLCQDHAADAERMESYLALAIELGVEVGR